MSVGRVNSVRRLLRLQTYPVYVISSADRFSKLNCFKDRRQIRFIHVTTARQQQDKKGGSGNNDKDDNDPKRNILKQLRGLLIATTAYIGISVLYKTLFPQINDQFSDDNQQYQRTVTWKEFVHDMLATGEVAKVLVSPPSTTLLIQLHKGAVVRGQMPKSLPIYYKMEVPDVNAFENNLRKAEQELGIPADQGVLVVYSRPSVMTYLVFYGIVCLIGYSIFKFTRKRLKPGTSMFTNMFDSVRKAKFREVDPSFRVSQNMKIGFGDVVGLKEAKVEIKEFVDYLKVPEKYTRLGAKLPKGALLLGPPGCGKTLLAKAVASEANVPFLATNGTEFVEMIGGLGAARVRDLFKEAKRRAPCMIYIDEIDAIGRKRSGEGSGSFGGNSEQEHTLNQLLVEMDGMDSAKGIVIIASTNRADLLDKALLRRGRFDRHIDIDLPTLIEREETFEHYLKKIKLERPAETFSKRLAKLTPGFSGADINNVCNEAAIRAATAEKSQVLEEHLNQALDRVLSGPEKRSTTVSPEEKEVVAYHECGHALVGWLLKHTSALLKVTIVPRTSNALGFAQYNPQDKKIYSEDELLDRMCMVLGGRAAENVVFRQATTGAHNDLTKVTQIAYDQVKNYGMSRAVGPISFAPIPGSEEPLFDKPYGRKLSALIDQEANAIVMKAYHKAEEILRQNRDKLNLLATTLLKQETLTYDEIVKLIGPPPYGVKKTTEIIELELPNPVPQAEEPAYPENGKSDSSDNNNDR